MRDPYVAAAAARNLPFIILTFSGSTDPVTVPAAGGKISNRLNFSIDKFKWLELFCSPPPRRDAMIDPATHYPSRRENSTQVRRVLEQAFGRGKVRVRSGKGTSSSWLYIDIAYAPRNRFEAQDLSALTELLIAKSGAHVGHHYPDDGYGSRRSSVLISFERRAA